MNYDETLRRLLTEGALDLPQPGAGRTAERHQRLLELARVDTGLGRLIEAHTDATAILTEAGRVPEPGAIYGVWASEAHGHALSLEPIANRYRLCGTKGFCTGAGLVDRALVTVVEPIHLLLDIDLRIDAPYLAFDHTTWAAPAFAATTTATTTFSDLAVADDDIIGRDRWYLDRAGFWPGACGPAACWAGGAIGLVDHARANIGDNPHALAHLGSMLAAEWALRAILRVAGDEIDAAAGETDRGASRSQALTVRHLAEQHALDIIARFGRALGPRPLAFEPDVIRRVAEVELYVRQHGGDRDLEVLGASRRP